MKENKNLKLKTQKYREDSLIKNSIIEVGAIRLIKFNVLSELEGLNHCFTTRSGGISIDCCDSLNLSFGREVSAENVQENYRRLMDAYGENDRSVAFTNQTHTAKIRKVDHGDDIYYGPGVFQMEELDGIITNNRDVTLFTYYGDCVPIYLFDKRNMAIGLVHSGWRGTVINAGGAGVEKMIEEYGTSAEDITAVIGPSIGPECFQVDYNVAVEFLNKYGEEAEVVYKDIENDKYLVDLWEANRLNLISSGIKGENIVISGLCTCCNEKLFFSHRRDKGKTGSMAALMTLKK